MYGNYEYGSLPYADVELVSVTILLDKRTIAVIYISRKKDFEFLSERKETTFKSQEYTSYTTGRK